MMNVSSITGASSYSPSYISSANQSKISNLEEEKKELQKKLEKIEESSPSQNTDQVKLLQQEIMSIDEQIQRAKSSSPETQQESQSSGNPDFEPSDSETSGLNELA